LLAALVEVAGVDDEEEGGRVGDGGSIARQARLKEELAFAALSAPAGYLEWLTKQHGCLVVDREVGGDGRGAQDDQQQPKGVVQDGRDRATVG
jgi:hypothetical protein